MKSNLSILCFILLSMALLATPVQNQVFGKEAQTVDIESLTQTSDGSEQVPHDDSISSEINVISPGTPEQNDLPDTESISDDSINISDVSIEDALGMEQDEQSEEIVVGATIRRDIADGLYLLVPKLNPSRCISIAGNSKANGANVQLVDKNGGFAQAFYVKKLAGTSRYTFVNYHTGKALEMENSSDSSGQSAVSANVIQNPLTNAQNQQWVIEELDNEYLQIRACGKPLVLHIAGGKMNAGTNIQVYKAHQSEEQMWTLVKAYGKVAAEARLADANLTKGYYRIVSTDVDGLSVDITSNSKNDGANIRLYKTLNSGAQIFRIAPEGDGTYVISGYNSGKYFDCADARAGSNIYQAGQRSSSFQRWYILKDPKTGNYVIRNKNGSHAVIAAEGDEAGANVGQGSFAGKSGQYWMLKKTYGTNIHVEPKDGIYEFRSCLDGKMCLDVAAGSSLNNANIQLYSTNASDAQRFAIVGSGYGVYKVLNVNSMRAMHLRGNGTASGTNVLQFKELSSTAQRWRISWNSKTGGYQIQSNGKSICLDVAGGKAVDGANVQANSVNKSAGQSWVLNKVSSYDGKFHMKVICSETTCTFKVYQIVKGVFTEKLSTSGFIGRNGSGKTAEDDGKTPIGTFTVGQAYGIADNPGSVIPYTNVTNDMYWCCRSDSPYYNKLIDAAKSGPGDKHLIDFAKDYHYLLDIGYNTECKPDLGSAIFLHCSQNQPTAGSIAIPREEMAKALKMITVGTKISIE